MLRLLGLITIIQNRPFTITSLTFDSRIFIDSHKIDPNITDWPRVICSISKPRSMGYSVFMFENIDPTSFFWKWNWPNKHRVWLVQAAKSVFYFSSFNIRLKRSSEFMLGILEIQHVWWHAFVELVKLIYAVFYRPMASTLLTSLNNYQTPNPSAIGATCYP